MKTNMRLILLSLVTVLALSVSCAARQAAPTSRPALQAERAVGGAASAPAPAQPSTGEDKATANAASTEGFGERMIIRNANMLITVEDTDKTVSAVTALAAERKGYIADSRRWYDGDRPFARLTLRVPAEALDEVMGKIRALVIRVDTENISGQDVTDQYTDNASRLRNLEATEKELLALMTEMREKRGKAEDILAVYKELNTIRSQIETLKGRQQYLERMTALATIQLEIRPKDAPKPILDKETWSPLVTLNRALRAFVGFAKVLVDVAIYLLVFGWPVILLVVIIWALARRSRQKKAAKPTEAPTEKK